MSRLSQLFTYFRSSRKTGTANIARARLQIIVSHERTNSRQAPDFLPRLQRELIDVISRYVPIQRDQVRVELARDGDCSVLELNVMLPDDER